MEILRRRSVGKLIQGNIMSAFNPSRRRFATTKNKANGYSIAEILLVFGIIAGVLIGVWAMYTMLGDESTAQTVVAEIQMLRSAAVEYKNTSAQAGTYQGISFAALKPYLGQSGLADGQNIFGSSVSVSSISRMGNKDLQLTYRGVTSVEMCRKILEHFGEVGNARALQYTDLSLHNPISGYISGNRSTSGCTHQSPSDLQINLIID